jgi:hypothetical protein
MWHSPTRALAVCVCFSGALLVPTSLARAQTPPPCPPGVAVTPALKAADPQDGTTDARLTATHVIVVTAEFPEDGPLSADDSTAVWTGPPGVPRLTRRSRNADDVDLAGDNQAGFVPPAAGRLPVSVTWQQSDGTRNGLCSGSASATFQIQAAKPLRPRAPRGTDARDPRRAGEYVWFTNVGRDSDRRPIEIRLRSVRGARLPGPRVPFKTAMVALRPTDAGWRARRRLLVRFLQARGSFEGAQTGFVNLVVAMRGVTANPQLGYELQLRQGSRRVGSIRAAGSCSAFGCDFSTFRVRR